MPAAFGLDTLALVLAAASTGPVASDSLSPPVPGGGGVTAVAIVPACPAGFAVKTASATLYECTTQVPGQHAAATAYIAGQTDCKYPTHWAGPQVTLSPIRGDAALVRWACTRR